MSVQTGPCSWPVEYGQCDLPDSYEALTPEERAIYEDMATAYLWRWTGKGFGICPVTISPCRTTVSDHGSTFWGSGPVRRVGWQPVLIRGLWYNVSCWACGDGCTCERPSILAIPGPVHSITEVVIDGVTLDPSEYRVDSGRFLVRTDGTAWPTDPDRWTITYDRGVEVPVGGQVAAGILAVELFKAACADPGCALPKRFQSITRQGVTVAMLDAFDDVERGHTGIWLIDSWLASVTAAPIRSAVYSPDIKRR